VRNLGNQGQIAPYSVGASRGSWQPLAFGAYHWSVVTAVKRLDLRVGELVEIAGRRYEVVPDREGGVTIEPPITRAAELHAKPASAEDFERLSVDVPFDDEG